MARLSTFLLTLVIYGLLAKAAVYAAVPPGFATAIWPAAGFAIAAVLVWGTSALPGVWLASCLVCAAVGWESFAAAGVGGALVVTGILGLGAALQAAIGAWLIRRLGIYPQPLAAPPSIGLFLLIAGPVASLIAASIGNLALLGSGSVSWRELPLSWLTWWLGDSIGAMLAAPLTLLWLRPADRTRRLLTTLPVLAVFLGVLAAYQLASRVEEARRQADFDRRANYIAEGIQRGFALYLENLRSLRQLFLASDDVSREEFSRFARDVLERHDGIQALEWTMQVPAGARAAFEAQVRASGLPGFRIREMTAAGDLIPRAPATVYYPITYIEPLVSNERALGFDVGASPIPLATLEKARDTGELALTGPIRLVQDRDNLRGVVGYLPVYRPQAKVESPELRREAFVGVVAGVFRMQDVMRVALANLNLDGTWLRLSDPALSLPAGTFITLPADLPASAKPVRQTLLPIGGQKWLLEIGLTRSGQGQQSMFPWAVLVGGSLFSALLMASLLGITGQKAEVERLVKQRTHELALAKERADAAVQARDEFLSVASHELKTPITSMQLGIQGLLSGLIPATPDNVEQTLARTARQIKRLSRLINELLSVSRLEAGRYSPQLQEVDLADVVRRVADLFADDLTTSGSRLILDASPTPGFWDAEALEQVVTNLLANALKFGKGEPIAITVYRQGQNGHLVVTDQGIGVPEDHLERIFDPFERAVSSRHYGGLGLGLYIVEGIVSALDGRVDVQSTVGQGTTFTIVLPCEPSADVQTVG